MVEIAQSTRINTDSSESDLKPGEYRDALNMSLIAHEAGRFIKGTTYGNIDTNIVFKGLQPDAICLGSAIDSAGGRAIITFFQKTLLPFSAEYTAILAYANSKGYAVPSKPVQAAQNLLIVLMKQNGVWIALDVFYNFYGDGDENFAKINWKAPGVNQCLNNGAMIYAPNYGFKGDGASKFIDTTWVPSTGIKYTQNNASIFLGIEESSVSSGGDGVLDAGNRCQLRPYTALNTINAAINSVVDTPGFVSNQFTENAGIIFASRSAAGATALRKNISTSIAGAIASSPRPTQSFVIGGINNSGAGVIAFTTNRYSCFGAGENLNTLDREVKFTKSWAIYKNSFVTPLQGEVYVQEVLMYLLTLPALAEFTPLIQSSLVFATERSYIDGYSFVNELFFFNFRDSAPKMINIERALSSPGFYNNVSETALTIIKPHPPFSPTGVRALGSIVNSPIQKKSFQFMMIYRFLDGEQSVKSPASQYFNSLDDRETLTSLYDHLDITMAFPLKDYPIVESIELFVRNTNNIADWRGVAVFPRSLFVQVGSNYQYLYSFFDNVVGNFYPIELATKINDAIPQKSNYLAFIENRLFMIDTLIDYDFVSAFQILLSLDANAATPDDRLPVNPLYSLAEFDYDSEYTVGIAFYDKYGRKHPSSSNDRKLVTPAFTPVALPAVGADGLPNQTVFAQLKKPKITAKYDLRAAGNINNYGKPPSFAFWWGMIRGVNTKWEFQRSVECLLRFPYSIVKWIGTDPAKFPPYTFLEDGYLYWDAAALLGLTGANLTRTMVNEYIDIVIPPNFPYTIDNSILIDFMMDICTDLTAQKVQILNREVIDIFANKIRIRGDSFARWFSNDPAGLGQYNAYPKFTTGTNLIAGQFLFIDETKFTLSIKRRRKNDLASIVLFDMPQIYNVINPGTRFCSFQNQAITISRVEYPPTFSAPQLLETLSQGDALIQPVNLAPTSTATNHAIKITWGANSGGSLGLKIKVSIWQLNDSKAPILELYSATQDANGFYAVKNNETVEYLINADAELFNGWYGYGIQILPYDATKAQFENAFFDLQLEGWLQSPDGAANLAWEWTSVPVDGNFVYVNISAMLGGYSKTLYQYLDKITKNDLSVEVVVEAVGIIGPSSGGPVTQNPGNNTPAVLNTVENIAIGSKNIIPYYINCSTGRVVTMVTLNFDLFANLPAGSQARCEFWSVDQTTKKPISALFVGAYTPVNVAGSWTLTFPSNVVVNISAWYGMAITIQIPSFSDFLNNDFSQGATNWEVTQELYPTWAFAPYQPPINEPIIASFPTSLGVLIDSYPLESTSASKSAVYLNPIYLSGNLDPLGFYNHSILVEWGNQGISGWQSLGSDVIMWSLNQTTKEPIAELTPAALIAIESSSALYVISATPRLTPGWYGYAVRPFSSRFNAPQFFGVYFGVPGFWFSSPGSEGTDWFSPGGGTGQYQGSFGGAGTVTTPMLYQNTPWGGLFAHVAVYVYLSSIDQGSPATAIKARLRDNLGVISEIDIDPALDTIGGTPQYFFPPFEARPGSTFLGVDFVCQYPVAGRQSWILTAIANVVESSIWSAPVAQRYAVQDADYETWVEVQSGILDPFFNYVPADKQYYGRVGGAAKYWFQTNVSPKKQLFQASAATANPSVSSFLNTFPSESDLFYTEANLIAGNYNIDIRGTGNTGGPSGWNIEIWVFDDPATYLTTGTLYQTFSVAITNWQLTGPTVVPAGKYIGWRFVLVSGTGLWAASVRQFILTPVDAALTRHWVKKGFTLNLSAYEQDNNIVPEVAANAYISNIPSGATSGRLGQSAVVGTKISITLYSFSALNANLFDIILTDSNGFELGRTSVGPVINGFGTYVVTGVNAPTSDGLFVAIKNSTASPLSVKSILLTNVASAITVAADSGIFDGKTWALDSSGNSVELTTTTVCSVAATESTPQPPLPLTVVLADQNGVEISVSQPLAPNAGKVTLVFSPTLQADLNYNYGVKVRNAATNDQIAGTVRIHSIQNLAENTSVANIIANTINGGFPKFEAWYQPSLGLFGLAGYVSNFIAVVDDLAVGAFTPIQIDPTSYHLVSNVVDAGIEGHSLTYGGSPDSTYNYGIVFPSASSDPDSAGIVYISKVGQSIGDINIKVTDLRQKSQSNVVRWSDPIIVGSKINNLNAFLDSNQYAVDFQRGAIQVMLAMHDHTLFCVHRQGMSSLYVNRAILTSPAEVDTGDQLVLSNKVVGNDNKLTSNLGTINPESCKVVESGTIAYGFDLVRKSLWQKSNNGVRNLTYECNAKVLFNAICFYRLNAYLEGEDVKIYCGYNEKQKTFYLTFAPFVYRGQQYSGITIGYNAYIDGFVSRYSFEPNSYLATEDVLYGIKSRELTNPDFFGRFSIWLTDVSSGGTANWFRSSLLNGTAEATTLVPAGTRILNPDFFEGALNWATYGAGSAWSFINDGASSTVLAGTFSRDLVNSSGAIGAYSLRVRIDLPFAGLSYAIYVYDGAGLVTATLVAETPFTSNDVMVAVNQTVVGRIGLIIRNTSGASITVNVRLFSTVVKTFLLYQPMPVGIENLRLRLVVPKRTGSIRALIYAFNDPTAPALALLHNVDLIRNKDSYTLDLIVPNTITARYIGLFTVSDYDRTQIEYFNVNSVPSVWAHNQVGLTNNFFGVQYDSSIALVITAKDGQVLIYNSLAIDSQSPWSVESILTSERQVSKLGADNFRLRDGIYYATIMRDILTPQDALPDPLKDKPITHGSRLIGGWIRMTLRNDETLRRIELTAMYLGSDELAGHILNNK